MKKSIVPLLPVINYAVPVTIAFAPFAYASDGGLRLVALLAALPLFLTSFLTLSGTVSLLGRSGIVRGKFPRDPNHDVYGKRRIYGACWTGVFYSGPIYWIFLSVPILRKTMFRLFGYQGSLNFVVYPDTWIRDLPVLEIGEGAYLSNKSTLGTNMCLSDGSILVDKIHIGSKALVGHLAMIAPGAVIEDEAEVGVGAAIGVRCRLEKGARVGPSVTINHGAKIGAGSEVGTHSYVGLRAQIKAGIKLPGGSNIPSGAVIGDLKDFEKVRDKELSDLEDQLHQLAHQFSSFGLREVPSVA